MSRIWAAQPDTTFSMIVLNLYIVDFTSERELLRVMNRGVWTYRGEIVAIQRIRGPTDLIRPQVWNLEVWVQWHGIPLESITKEGLVEISTRVGKPRSEVYEAFANGKKFFRIKMMIPIEAKLKPFLNATHPNLGPFNIYLVYEKLTKVCLFCARMGHKRLDCPDNIRIERLREDPRFENSPELDNIPSIRIGSWINNQSQLPIIDTPPHTPTWQQPFYTNLNPQPQTPPNMAFEPGTARNTQTGPSHLSHLTGAQDQPINLEQINPTSMLPISGLFTGTQPKPFLFEGSSSEVQQEQHNMQRSKKYIGRQKPKRKGSLDLQVVMAQDPENNFNLNDQTEESAHINKKRALEVSPSPPSLQ